MNPIRIALAGNPNCGKTTLFNALTGSAQSVGNWPGVTVEKKDGHLRGRSDVLIEDLPGVYSLSPYTQEEVVARRYLTESKPDVIVNVVDASNLERNLYLTTQLRELGLPLVLALNLMDVVHKNGDVIHVPALGKAFGCPVVEVSALHGEGIERLAEVAIAAASTKRSGELPHVFSGGVEHALAHIEESIQDRVPAGTLRYYAIKLFERDEATALRLGLNAADVVHIEQHATDCEAEMGDTAEGVIADQRYRRVGEIVARCLKRRRPAGSPSVSERIDRIVTGRFLALPIFALAIWAIYYVSVSTVGAWAAAWSNDTLFGRWLPALADRALSAIGAGAAARSLVLDGILAGVGSVLGFVPQILLVFFFLAFLEDCGYMARIAFIMDRLFRRFGLSGKSFIPLLVGTGCGVTAVLSARTIESRRDRRLTVLLSTFMPCSAKIEVIAVVAAAFFPGSVWVAPGMFFLGVLIVFLSGLAFRKSTRFRGEPSPFVMELPDYRLPSAENLWRHTWERGRSFCVKAGTVIFAACCLIWFLSHFSADFTFLGGASDERSILAAIGRQFAWIFTPLGFGNWRGAVAVFSAGFAKEQATATLGILAGAGDRSVVDAIGPLFRSFSPYPALAAFSFLLANLFNPPCIAAVAATFREMGSRRLGVAAVLFQTLVGYGLALTVYQLGSWALFGAPFGLGQVVSLLLVAFVAHAVLRPAPHAATPAPHAATPTPHAATLGELPVGHSAVIRALGGSGALRRRVMDMGLTKGTPVRVRKVAPLGDPIEITVRGYELTIRKADAAIVEMDPS